MNKKPRIGIMGATGYVGMELVRILNSHPGFTITRLMSQSFSGRKFSDIYPSFRGLVDTECTDNDIDKTADECDIVITALPHGVSSQIVPDLLDRGLRVIDHSGDFRYKDSSVYEAAYNLSHPRPDLLSEAVYGLPEISGDKLKTARLVANPGCYPTCSILALTPLLINNVISKDNIVINAASGVSGAGRKSDLAFSFCESSLSFRAYNPVGHRHTSEIEEILSGVSGSKINLSFTPHLIPVNRGMLATVNATLNPGFDRNNIQDIFESYYGDNFFVRILEPGTCPDTKNVIYTNFADISVFTDPVKNKVIVLSAIDNLGKGAALQAVQSLNIMTGQNEKCGLMNSGGGI